MLGFPIYTRDKTSPRAFRWIWFIRILQIFVTLFILAITAANTASFGNASCGVPGKLAWNLACVRHSALHAPLPRTYSLPRQSSL